MGMLEVAGLAVPVRRCQRPEVWPEPKKRASLKQYSLKPGSEHGFREIFLRNCALTPVLLTPVLGK
jgi:hypothetical protein